MNINWSPAKVCSKPAYNDWKKSYTVSMTHAAFPKLIIIMPQFEFIPLAKRPGANRR